MTWKDKDPTAVINIIRRALGGPEKLTTEYADEAWGKAWDEAMREVNERTPAGMTSKHDRREP